MASNDVETAIFDELSSKKKIQKRSTWTYDETVDFIAIVGSTDVQQKLDGLVHNHKVWKDVAIYRKFFSSCAHGVVLPAKTMLLWVRRCPFTQHAKTIVLFCCVAGLDTDPRRSGLDNVAFLGPWTPCLFPTQHYNKPVCVSFNLMVVVSHERKSEKHHHCFQTLDFGFVKSKLIV